MSYREIPANIKAELVLRLLAGERPTSIETESSIPRKTLYEWKKKAIDAIYALFRETRPGPKGMTSVMLQDCDSISQNEKAIPCHCPKCDSDKIVKNGIYQTIKGETRQRLVCRACYAKITIEKKTM